MKSWQEFLENKMNEKVCIIMRGISGTGKSTKTREILKKYGVSIEGHVFSADRQFHKQSNILATLDISQLDPDEMLKHATDVLELWYSCKHSPLKVETQPAFLDFKKLYDVGEYRQALEVAKNMHPSLEAIEYTSNWSADRLHGAHKSTNFQFKNAIDKGITPVIVDNTNVRAQDMKSYVQYATDAEYDVSIQEPDSPHWKQYKDYLKDKYGNKEKIAEFAQLLHQKNVHGVPLNNIEQMIARWQPNLSVKDVLGEKD